MYKIHFFLREDISSTHIQIHFFLRVTFYSTQIAIHFLYLDSLSPREGASSPRQGLHYNE